MAEFVVEGARYRSKLLNAYDQWVLLTHMRPILPALAGMDSTLRLGAKDWTDISAILAPLFSAPDEDISLIFRACLTACERELDARWLQVEIMPGLRAMMAIAVNVVGENFGPLFSMKRPQYQPVSGARVHYPPVYMPDGEDWLFRPVIEGACRAESIWNGALRIEQIAKLNDALDVKAENEARIRKAAENK